MEETFVLPDEKGKDSELTNEKKQSNDEQDQKNKKKKSSDDNSNEKLDKESDINEENEDTNTEKEFSENEERQFNSDRKLNKLMKQINQYALAMDRIEKNSCMTESSNFK